MENKEIFVSVLMSVYSERIDMLQKALVSILNQSFSNLEFLVYLDKPDNEKLWYFLQDYAKKDSRLIVHKNEVNRSLAGTLNDELKVAKGNYIVRMDGDDISVPNRIKILVDYMESHPDIGVASSWMKEFGNIKFWRNKIVRYTSDFEIMRLMMLYKTPIAHAPCIIRRSVIDDFGPALYNEKCSRTQDYELWSRLIDKGVKFGMICKPLYLRRKSGDFGPNPISYKVIHNQIARKNVQNVLNKYGVKLPDVVDNQFIDQVYNLLGIRDVFADTQLKIILCECYCTLFRERTKMLKKIISNHHYKIIPSLPLQSRIHFLLRGHLCNINNLVINNQQIIY